MLQAADNGICMNIKTENLSFGYNGTPVLKGVNLLLPDNKIIGVLGPNGSGKSTLLKLLGGFLKPESGNIYIGDKNINEISNREKSKLMSFVAQNYNFAFCYSVYEFIMMGRFPYLNYLGFESAKDIEVAESVMALTNTAYLGNRMIGTLSGGEAQRILMAQALASDPRVLFLDEPLNHLDIKYQVEVLDLIKKLNNENKITIVMAIHDINLASGYCDEVIFLKDGAVFKAGPPREIVTKENIFEVFGVSVRFIKEGENNFIFPAAGLRKQEG